jgi:hypothetical protein
MIDTIIRMPSLVCGVYVCARARSLRRLSRHCGRSTEAEQLVSILEGVY